MASQPQTNQEPQAAPQTFYTTNNVPLNVTQLNSPDSRSVLQDGITTIVKKKVPIVVPAQVEWVSQVIPKVGPAQELVQEQPRLIYEEIPSFPLRKPGGPVVAAPVRERAVRERAAPPPQYKDVYIIKEVPQEVVQVVEKKVQVPFEKIIYQDRIVEVEKVVTQESARHIEVPVDRVIERKVPVEKVIEKIHEVTRDRTIEIPVDRIVEVPIEKIVEVQFPVDKIVEVPYDRIVEVPVERQVEEIVHIESEPVFETRQRKIQVPVTVMQEQVIEEQVEVGFRYLPAQDRYSTERPVERAQYVQPAERVQYAQPTSYVSRPSNVQYQQPIQRQYMSPAGAQVYGSSYSRPATSEYSYPSQSPYTSVVRGPPSSSGYSSAQAARVYDPAQVQRQW